LSYAIPTAETIITFLQFRVAPAPGPRFHGLPINPNREVSVKATLICAVAAALFAPPALAADSDAKSTQQTRFTACAHESKGLRGDEHQKFMSDCLKGHRTTAENASQPNRMKSCNEEARAKDLHGDERRAFMSACLKG
jgi:hypothetical protein